jgi:hypothetical protein
MAQRLRVRKLRHTPLVADQALSMLDDHHAAEVTLAFEAAGRRLEQRSVCLRHRLLDDARRSGGAYRKG